MRMVLLLALLLTGGACAAPDERAAQRESERSESVMELRSAPTEIVVGGVTVALATSLWVNAAPTMPETSGPEPIRGIVNIVGRDSQPIETGTRITHVWLVRGGQVWERAKPEEQDAEDPSYTDAQGIHRNRPGSPTFRVVLRSGPAWGADGAIADAAIDVVARVADSKGRTYLLRAAKQPIGRVQ